MRSLTYWKKEKIVVKTAILETIEQDKQLRIEN